MLRQPNRKGVFLSNDHVQDFIYSQCHMHIYLQGCPVSVKHGTRCAMSKVGGRQKNKIGGILMYYYKFAVLG